MQKSNLPIKLQKELQDALESARLSGKAEAERTLKKAWKKAGRHRNGTTQGLENAWEEFDNVMDRIWTT